MINIKPAIKKHEAVLNLMARSSMDLASAIKAINQTGLFDREGYCLTYQEDIEDSIKTLSVTYKLVSKLNIGEVCL